MQHDFHLEQTSGSGWLGMWYSIAQWFRWLLAQCFPKTWSWTGIPALRGQRGSFNSSNPLEEEWEHCWPAAANWTIGPTLRFKHSHTHTVWPQQGHVCMGMRYMGGPLLGSHQSVGLTSVVLTYFSSNMSFTFLTVGLTLVLPSIIYDILWCDNQWNSLELFITSHRLYWQMKLMLIWCLSVTTAQLLCLRSISMATEPPDHDHVTRFKRLDEARTWTRIAMALSSKIINISKVTLETFLCPKIIC